MSAPADKKDGPWNQETKEKFNKYVSPGSAADSGSLAY